MRSHTTLVTQTGTGEEKQGMGREQVVLGGVGALG